MQCMVNTRNLQQITGEKCQMREAVGELFALNFSGGSLLPACNVLAVPSISGWQEQAKIRQANR